MATNLIMNPTTPAINFPQVRKPIGNYNGMCIVFSQPSRFDMRAGKWLEGYAGIYFQNTAMKGLLVPNCELRLATYDKPLPYGTKVVLLLGQRALDTYLKVRQQLIDTDIRLNQQRGSPVVSQSGIIYIATFLPQDAMDLKASYEKDHNEYLQAQEQAGEEEDDKEEANEAESKSTKGATSRNNFRFFLRKDCQKAIALLAERLLPETINTESFEIYPPAETVIHELVSNKNADFYFDIETMDYEYNMPCFGFSFGDTGTVFVVPFYRHDYTPAYTELPQMLLALAIALRDNTCVGHNIAGFDLMVLAKKYGIVPGRKNYDTMIAMHRLQPEIEKSLGHGLSLYTCLGYHKNEGIFSPKSIEDERQLWFYNGKDVASLKNLKRGIEIEAAKKFALESIAQANDSIRPYITIMLTGIRYDQKKLEATIADNDRRLNALMKIITWLVGYEVLPTSSTQCVKYFHDALGMPVVGLTPAKKPSLDEKNLYKLALKAEHPLIPIFVYFRQKVKETGSLGFIPWKALPVVEQQPEQ